MSILIKGMKMPSGCKECQMCVYYMHTGGTACHASGEVLAKNFHPIAFEGRHEACPLVELPEKHGRLIDADAMCNDLATVDPRYKTMIDWCIRVTEAQPTIVEAEGKEDGKCTT